MDYLSSSNKNPNALTGVENIQSAVIFIIKLSNITPLLFTNNKSEILIRNFQV